MITMLLATVSAPAGCAEERKAVLEIADTVAQRYVIEENAERDAKALRQKARNGEYDRYCDDSKEFALFLTTKLRQLTSDKHYYVEYAASSNNNNDGWIQEWRDKASENSFGIRRVERLDHNIAYIHMSGFYEYEPAQHALQAAFTLASTSDALILDLRDNGGGSPETAWPIAWTFMQAGSPISLRMESRTGNAEALTEASFSWQRYGTSRPLVILTSKRSFSAAEAVAYDLQAQGRATIIGERTGGGAHMLGDGIAISGGWKVNIPETRPISIYTNTNWESDGVIPDIEVAANEALATAVRHLEQKIQITENTNE